MITNKRTQPLTAHRAHDDVEAELAALEASVVPLATRTVDGRDRANRDQRFVDGVRTLRVGGATVQLSERILLVLAGVVAPFGLLLVLLGYMGASRTPFLFEQMSYLISGGILGLALVFLGAFFYFAHWLTQLVKEHRVQSVAMLEALQRLQDQVAKQGIGQVAAPVHAIDAGQMVATARGTMAHRPDCVVVAGKGDLRAVTASDGLVPCKLCEPF